MPQTVLIVDDSPALHELIKVHLSDEALRPHSAFDGPSGLALAVSLKPDLILLDVDMPGMDGFEVCRRLKASAATEDVPVIFLTAADSVDQKKCGFDLRAVDYVTKPFDPSELLLRVRSALRTKRLLDMLPGREGAARPPGRVRQAGGGRHVNARLSLKQLTLARSANPWNRKPPPGNANRGHCTA